MTRRLWIALMVASLLVPTARAQSGTKKSAEKIDGAKIDSLVQPYVDAQLVNAVAIGVVRGDETWFQGYGSLSADATQKPTATTVFEIGSVSKVFTSTLLADAVENGSLQLDQPIGDLSAALKKRNPALANSVQLRHLATHTSGLPRMPANFAPADPSDPYADYDRGRMLAFLSTLKPTRPPGDDAEYSNLAVGLLGELLSGNAKADYDALLQKTICEPLQMSDTSVALRADQEKRLAPPHGEGLEANSLWEFQALAGAGAIRSTTEDMVRFIRANLDPPRTDLGKAIELAWKQHLPAKGNAFAMGLGWHIARDGATRWHNGQTGGYHSMLMVNRNSDAGVIVLCNTATGEVDAIGESIIQLLSGMDVKPRKFDAPKVDPELLARLSGKYQLAPGFVVTIRAKGDRLFAQATGQQEFRIYPDSDTEWHLKVVDARLTFQLPEQGKCTVVTLHQNGQNIKGKRVP